MSTLIVYTEVNELIGKTMTSVVNTNNEELVFTTNDGKKYKLFHEQDCCEYVTIEDIAGDLDDLIGSPMLIAEEVSNKQRETDDGSETWTFYKFATIKGYIIVRWYGSSNGYYSESVDFVRIQ